MAVKLSTTEKEIIIDLLIEQNKAFQENIARAEGTGWDSVCDIFNDKLHANNIIIEKIKFDNLKNKTKCFTRLRDILTRYFQRSKSQRNLQNV